MTIISISFYCIQISFIHWCASSGTRQKYEHFVNNHRSWVSVFRAMYYVILVNAHVYPAGIRRKSAGESYFPWDTRIELASFLSHLFVTGVLLRDALHDVPSPLVRD